MTPNPEKAFAGFFEAVRGYEPFPWQARLAAKLAHGDVPKVVDVPTGLGKTAIVEAWAYALAAQATADKSRLPRRLCFVVDRRLIVDQTFEAAARLAAKLQDSMKREGPLTEVARALSGLSAGGDPLHVVRMRGGVTWESRWLATPTHPAVVVGTVDQFGSRLLFRGYGTTPAMRPIDAALVGLDSWLVIDEAHLSDALVATTQAIARLQEHEALADLRMRITQLSATAKATGSHVAADITSESRSSDFPAGAAEAAQRLSASKPATLLDLTYLGPKPRIRWSDKGRRFGTALADVAMAAPAKGCVVGVIANTVASARAAFERIVSKRQEAILLIGRCRERERDLILDRWLPLLRPWSERSQLGERALYVVATQTIEVGADLDFDFLVTEAAPISALIQRFGRVNRAGDRDARTSAIVYAGLVNDPDPVYGPATSATWTYLTGRQSPLSQVRAKANERWTDHETLDFGLIPARQLHSEAPPSAFTEPEFVPVLLSPHLDRWAATNPAPFPDQTVDAFLHGVGRSNPEVEVAWRAAPPAPFEWDEWLRLPYPVSWEFVSVPVWEVQALLASAPSPAPTADIEGALVNFDGRVGSDDTPASSAVGVVYNGPTDPARKIYAPGDVAAGDRVILDSALGGHDEWGWIGAAERGITTIDVADLAPSRGRPTLRLCESVYQGWTDNPIRWPQDDLRDPAVRERLLNLIAADTEAADLKNKLKEASSYTARPISLQPPEPDTPWSAVFLVGRRAARAGEVLDAVSDSDPLTTSSVSTEAVPLAAHGAAVAERAQHFARLLDLPESLSRVIELAARYHDIGKVDARFQIMLHRGDSIAALAAATPLAKSGMDLRDPATYMAWRLSGLPVGFRHEAISERLAAELLSTGIITGGEMDTDLLLHLIASHHGWSRPLYPPLVDPDPEPVSFTVDGVTVSMPPRSFQVNWEQPARMHQLHRRYGWWTLAFLETIVRLADMQVSEEGS